jgi:hypothetical protein
MQVVKIKIQQIGGTIFIEDGAFTTVKGMDSRKKIVEWVALNTDCFSFHAFCTKSIFDKFVAETKPFGFEFTIDSQLVFEDTNAFDFFGFATV